MLDFVRHHGWVYGQEYGGGPDEHVALFASSDPAVVERVHRYAEYRARQDPNWHLLWRR
ncbi:hypothetical protein [Tahibacter amnicola]|uniref:Uncharacterized protein n=1 Tax=Tahibacter amnicola TaxID=2976241 RepID=A0ABY6BHM6_9GAMM|nr:hypothetical protein [Tahibacter amnicola]UXI68111.1 hypothetical protein N4264_00210 [Tahibacter amnicola]